MRIQQLMSRTVQSCAPEDSLKEAAQLMWDHDCGCLPVVHHNGAARIAGVITDRDICMCALFRGRPLRELRVADAMSSRVRTCRSTDRLSEAETIMREARIRRLPVVDDDDALVGMLSLADLAQEALRENVTGRRAITESEVGDTLAAICAPQHKELVVGHEPNDPWHAKTPIESR
jgi:CBS domain-containing protein